MIQKPYMKNSKKKEWEKGWIKRANSFVYGKD